MVRKCLLVLLLILSVYSSTVSGQVLISEEVRKRFYPDGKLQSKHTYKKGVLNGLTKIYWESGGVKREIRYKNGLPEGISREYYENGILLSYKEFKNGKLQGEEKEYYPNGSLYREAKYKTGQLDGVERTYFGNGKVQSVKNFKEGKEDGIFLLYDENGNLLSKENFKGGQREGISKFYHPNGKLKVEVSYRDGLKEGVSKEFDMKGNLIVESVYKQGQIEGSPVRYDTQGNVLVQVNFLETLMPPVDISAATYTDEEGTIGISLSDETGSFFYFCLEAAPVVPVEGLSGRWRQTGEPRALFLSALHPTSVDARDIPLGAREEKMILKILEDWLAQHESGILSGKFKSGNIRPDLIIEVVEELKRRGDF